MNKITVSLLSDSFPPIIDGVANAVVNYAEQINKEWGTAIVATPAYPGANDKRIPFQVIRYPSIDVRKITTGYVAGIPFSPELMSRLTKQRVDILHAHAPMMSALLMRSLRKRLDAPAILTYHTKYDIDIANIVKSKALQMSGIKSVVTNTSSFDEVWVVSKGAGENLRSLGYQGDYIVMPNGVDLPRQEASDPEVSRTVSGYDLPRNIPVFLYVGRLMWYKGFRITLDALKMLKEQGDDFRMVIIGDGGDGKAIRSYVLTKGLSDKVIFLGTVSDRAQIRAWYTRADLFLFPSTFDSNGLVVREAAACNVPSVLIKGSCAAEDVTDGRNAFLIEENARSMAQLLHEAIKDLSHLHEVGVHAGDDLYLSWEDAVAHAVSRYHIVQEIYRSGGFDKTRASISDNLLATQGDLMYTVSRITDALNQTRSIARNLMKTMNPEKKPPRRKRIHVKTAKRKR